jgi:signal transduction histidine kinase/ketosteroid isomerase-like protein
MKLTKKLEAEILRAYNDMWQANFRGDIKTFASYLDDQVLIFGSAEGEILRSKKEAEAYYEATADQMTGKAEFRNRRTTVRNYGDTVVVNEENDLYVLAVDEWIFYGHTRISGIFELRRNRWKLVHMHGSFPDSRTEAGEQIAPEKIKAENIQLRDAVRRRTVELEEKNRELEIETALEKVRLVAMGMKSPEDMLRICTVISQQLGKLGLKDIRNVQTAIFYPERGTYMNYEYYAKHDKTFVTDVDYQNHSIQLNFARKMMKGPNEEVREHLQGKQLRDWYDFQKTTNQFADEYILQAESLNYYWFSLGPVALGISTYAPLRSEETDLFKRFLKVFELAYQRYVDIEKAVEQAREAQIEAALERVRSRTMAMHKSDELTEVASLLFRQIRDLGVKAWTTGFNIWSEDKNSYVDYVTDPEGNFIEPYTVDTSKAPVLREMREAKNTGQEFYVNYEEGEAIKETYRVLMSFGQKGQYEKLLASGFQFPEKQYNHFAFGAKVSLLFVTYDPVPEAHDIFKRFCKVFEQTYTRFLDLQKAEAQAKESQIQLALERVRARTMAMQRSEELPEVAALLFQQVKALGVPQFHCGFNIFEIDDKECTWYPGSADGDILPPCKIPLTEHPVFMAFSESRKRGDELFVYEKEGEYQAGHYRYMLSLPVLGEILQNMLDAGIPFPTFQIDHVANFSHGNLLFITAEHVPEMHDTFKRFAKVFEQTYTRFLDLQKAEAQARDAQIEAALEKVRSRTMAMQSSDELADAAYTLFEQLNVLGVAHERINIGIVNEENQTIDFWVTEQGGEKLNTKFSGRISEPTTLSKAYTAWKKGEKSIMIDLQGEALAAWLRFMNEEIKIPFNKAYLHNRRVQTAGFFSKGMLVVTSPEPLRDEALYLLEKFAGVFDLTYTRFNDLKIAEAHALQAEKDLLEIKTARQKAEQALTELKATQAQLVQQEKLASLGQLTAGIAHEIQNPLNFVNNFSEINAELSEEILEAASKGDIEEVKALAIDIRSNQEKIREHGKRADSIVKGMLQHSRSSSGVKEPTDINKLADEYLRLAYHGLRAKDKSFNASIETDFNNDIGPIPLMPQEMGRVLLNLFNNAFYAVHERSRSGIQGYEPTVTVSTKTHNAKVYISVQDNGPGVPETIWEKIFQPFFTTKPTGQGTGLGLSLSYDIVTKGHGGEITLQTKDGVGTTFTISLPLV